MEVTMVEVVTAEVEMVGDGGGGEGGGGDGVILTIAEKK